MNCNRARSEIALWVGHDLQEPIQQEVRRHVADCPECRCHWSRLKAGRQALQESSRELVTVSEGSLWPGLAACMRAREAFSQRHRFNGWLPATAVVASWLMIAGFWLQSSHQEQMAARARLQHNHQLDDLIPPLDASPVQSVSARVPPRGFRILMPKPAVWVQPQKDLDREEY